MKQAIILAGGKGTRLQSRLNGMPKPLVDICGKPLLERQIDLLFRYRFENVILLVNHKADKIQKFLDLKNKWNISIECIDDGDPLGTAGATIAAHEKLQEKFLVMYGDTMLDVDLDRFEKFDATNPKASATLFLHPNDHPQDSDLVEMDQDNNIVAFHSYPHPENSFLPNLVNAGLYWIKKDIFNWIGHEKKYLDFGKDVFPGLIKKGLILRGYNSPEYIKDCGTPERLDKVCAHFQSGRISSQNLQNLQPAVFLDRDGTINKEVGHIYKAEDLHIYPFTPAAIKLLNNSLYRTIVITNQPVIARGDCTEIELKSIHNKMETELGRSGAYLDRIEFCPHHPDGGFAGERAQLKMQCNCRKPEIGMIKKSAIELNLELSKSWLIGDSTADILAAKKAGLKSILLETGNAGLDEKYQILPDFTTPNLLTAVKFILHDYAQINSLIDSFNLNISQGNFIFVGGLSRNGKSIFANCLKYNLVNNNIDAKVISIDGWLKKDRYKNAKNVIQRYDVNAIKELIYELINSNKTHEIEIPIYSKSTGYARTFEKLNNINNKTVYIFEGTIALYLSKFVEGRGVTTIHLDADENYRMNRVLKEYKLRGKSDVEALEIYNSRLNDENFVINELKKHANHIIKINLSKE